MSAAAIAVLEAGGGMRYELSVSASTRCVCACMSRLGCKPRKHRGARTGGRVNNAWPACVVPSLHSLSPVALPYPLRLEDVCATLERLTGVSVDSQARFGVFALATRESPYSRALTQLLTFNGVRLDTSGKEKELGAYKLPCPDAVVFLYDKCVCI
jgi:hypothetical protein